MILRISQKLNSKIKAGTLKPKPLDKNQYADWSCHLFTADRTQYIIMSNTKSLYSCCMFGRGIADDCVFIRRWLSTIREFMDDDGQQFVHRRFIAPSTETITFAKALNRSVTGSMNDLVNHAKEWLEMGEVSPHDVGFKLNGVWLSALAESKTDGYGKPNDAFKKLTIEAVDGTA